MDNEISEALIEGIVKIGNNEDFINLVEPHVAEPLSLYKWMVKRTLTALALLQEEVLKEKNETT